MKTKLLLSVLLSFCFYLLSSQVPQGFNYQAIARDDTGEPIANSGLPVTISVQSQIDGGTVFWVEEHPGVTTNAYGLFNLIIGEGVRQSGTEAEFSDIDWKVQPKFIKTQILYKSALKDMGTSELWSVPYSMVAGNINDTLNKLFVKGETADLEEALFQVKNKDGQIIFAVYNEGVRVYVADGDSKGKKGGFAIGGFGAGKSGDPEQEYFVVSRDSIRAYIYDDPMVKRAKGGFAIGGFGAGKGSTNDYMVISPDSARIYIDNAASSKGKKGGFAIGGFGAGKSADPQKLLTVSDDSIRMYINDDGKAAKGGFAIGGFGAGKGAYNSFLNVETDATGVIDPSQNRIMWYPLKNAFLVGKVLIEKPDSVGENSFAAGFETKPKGDFSQALGYKARTEGVNSTAIGNYAFAKGNNSFALGDSALVTADDAYAIGAYTLATGRGSFAIGSKDKLFADNFVLSTSATGDLSMAIGLDADAEGLESFAAGIEVNALGDYSVALGRSATASGMSSMAMQGGQASGSGAIAIGGNATEYGSLTIGSGTSSGWKSVVIGSGTASASYSFAIGEKAKATGYGAIAVGNNVTAQSSSSFVIGSYNLISGSPTYINATDPLFVIGNGTYLYPSNAFTVLKNGYTAIGHAEPTEMLDVNGNARFRNVLSGPNASTLYVTTNGTLRASTSDISFKDNISTLKNSLGSVLNLRGVSFLWKNEPEMGKRIGFIAQEVEDVLPELVFTNPADGYKGVNYAEMSAVLVEAVKEQQAQIEAAKQENIQLKSELDLLKARMEQIEVLLTSTSAK